MQQESSGFLSSIYANYKYGPPTSFKDELQNPQNIQNIQNIQDIFNTHYLAPLLKGIEKYKAADSIDDASEIIGRGITLSRLYIEIVDKKDGNETLFKNNKKWKEAWEKFYGKNGLVESAQENVKSKFPGFEGIFDSVLSEVNNKEDLKADRIKAIIASTRTSFKENPQAAIYNLDHKDEDIKVATTIGTLLSNPHALAATLAIAGDKNNGGKFSVELKETPWTPGRGLGLAKSTMRGIGVVGVLAGMSYIATIMPAVTVAGMVIPAAALVGLAVLLSGFIMGSIATYYVKKEQKHTQENAEEWIGESTIFSMTWKNLGKFIMGPYQIAKNQAIANEIKIKSSKLSEKMIDVKTAIEANVKAGQKINGAKYLINLETMKKTFSLLGDQQHHINIIPGRKVGISRTLSS